MRYSNQLAEKICKRIAGGESLQSICKGSRMPAAWTVHRWVIQDKEGFREKYEAARRCYAWHEFESITELAQKALTVAHGAPGTGEASAKVQAIKLEVETKKWLLSKLLPKDFGDRMMFEHSGPDGGPIQSQSEFRMTPEDEAFIKRVQKTRKEIEGVYEAVDQESDE